MKLPLNICEIPQFYKRYKWNDRHSLWGYRSDEFPSFEWISSLERRFSNLEVTPAQAPIYLIREMIHWGGSQNGVLEKFELQLGTYNLAHAFELIREGLNDPGKAISAALDIPGMGLSYASKLLRFLRPETYGALDSQIRKFLLESRKELPFLNVIYDGNRNSMVNGYVKFIAMLKELKASLEDAAVPRPSMTEERLTWRASDIEMALFQRSIEWSEERKRAKAMKTPTIAHE
ncbi:hypothetical protein LXM60_00640 [Pandoraea sputorum]|uniref:hypothetical protein n=1 Tax=Pandoraea sputorum TaxID=93222 RepID=UPI001E481B22|nr:hypothetical protein [Pandoraea sputorum]MCE4058716.1 hypothetical protein [Pandoraea sputorum]